MEGNSNPPKNYMNENKLLKILLLNTTVFKTIASLAFYFTVYLNVQLFNKLK